MWWFDEWSNVPPFCEILCLFRLTLKFLLLPRLPGNKNKSDKMNVADMCSIWHGVVFPKYSPPRKCYSWSQQTSGCLGKHLVCIGCKETIHALIHPLGAPHTPSAWLYLITSSSTTCQFKRKKDAYILYFIKKWVSDFVCITLFSLINFHRFWIKVIVASQPWDGLSCINQFTYRGHKTCSDNIQYKLFKRIIFRIKWCGINKPRRKINFQSDILQSMC